MIDPLQRPTKIHTNSAGVGSYTALEDLLLIAVYLTVFPSDATLVSWILSPDPEGLAGENDFQLKAYFRDRAQVERTQFENLCLPLLKDQTLYWSTSDAILSTVQLIFQLPSQNFPS